MQYGHRDARCHLVFRGALLICPPSDLPAFIDEVCIEYDNDEEMQLTIENTIFSLSQARPGWTEMVALYFTPDALFRNASTEGPTMAAFGLARESQFVKSLLQEGARGEWGGNVDQVRRALACSTALLADDPAGAQAFLLSVVDSTTLPSEPVFGGMLVAQLSFQTNRPGNDIPLMSSCILEVLTDLRFREQAARQLYSMYGLEPPPGMPSDQWDPIRQEISYILHQ